MDRFYLEQWGSAVGKLISFGGLGGVDYSRRDSHLDWLRWASRRLCLHLLKTLVTICQLMAVLFVDSGDVFIYMYWITHYIISTE